MPEAYELRCHLFPEPRYRDWLFTPDNADEAAADMVMAIVGHGLPFMRSMKTLSDFDKAMAARLGGDELIRYRWPVVCLLDGDVGKAEAILRDLLDKLGTRMDAAAARFRRFADAFESFAANL